jgi:hypothetical protein
VRTTAVLGNVAEARAKSIDVEPDNPGPCAVSSDPTLAAAGITLTDVGGVWTIPGAVLSSEISGWSDSVRAGPQRIRLRR